MNRLKGALAVLLVLASLVPDLASADRGRSHRGHGARIGVHIGMPLYWGWSSPYYGYSPYYAYPPYSSYPYYAYPPPVVAVPSSPPVYVEREDDGAGSSRSGGRYWYYCDRPEGYYPDVKECPGGWERVAPRSAR